MLVGASLGAVSGTASLALYLLAGLVLAFYADGKHALYPFVPGDLFKLYIAAAALPTAWRLVERVKGTGQ